MPRFNVGDKVVLVPFREAIASENNSGPFCYGISMESWEAIRSKSQVFTVSYCGTGYAMLEEDDWGFGWPLFALCPATESLLNKEAEPETESALFPKYQNGDFVVLKPYDTIEAYGAEIDMSEFDKNRSLHRYIMKNDWEDNLVVKILSKDYHRFNARQSRYVDTYRVFSVVNGIFFDYTIEDRHIDSKLDDVDRMQFDM